MTRDVTTVTVNDRDRDDRDHGSGSGSGHGASRSRSRHVTRHRQYRKIYRNIDRRFELNNPYKN